MRMLSAIQGLDLIDVMQVWVMPVEQDNPMGLLQTSNTAFTKLSTLLVYLVVDIDRHAQQVQAPACTQLRMPCVQGDHCQL